MLLLTLRFSVLQSYQVTGLSPSQRVPSEWTTFSLLFGQERGALPVGSAGEEEEGGRGSAWRCPHTQGCLPVALRTTLTLESIAGFSCFLSGVHSQGTCPRSLPPRSPSAGCDKCHLFSKVALEKGNLTAVRQNREPQGSPLSTRVQSREQSQEDWELPGTRVQARALRGSPPPSSPPSCPCLLLLVSWLVTQGPREAPQLWGWEPSPPWAAD